MANNYYNNLTGQFNIDSAEDRDSAMMEAEQAMKSKVEQNVDISSPDEEEARAAKEKYESDMKDKYDNLRSASLKEVSNSGKYGSSYFDDPDNAFKIPKRQHKMYGRKEIDLYHKTYRYGVFNPYGALTTTREFLFFTKPDLHILARDDVTGVTSRGLVSGLESKPFWNYLYTEKPYVIESLQSSHPDSIDPFNHLLQNTVISNLDIPSLSAETVDTPTNMYGVGFSYRGSSESSDDTFDFSLEFKDTRWLDVYSYFKAYEEYETAKHHGVIAPWQQYTEKRIIHDQFSIYKFLVDEDMETIVYYCKYYGVMPKSLPRDTFSSASFDNGLSYSIDFRAAFFEDMQPEILYDFNYVGNPVNSISYSPYAIEIYDSELGGVDYRPATSATVIRDTSKISPSGYVWKLKWRGTEAY